MILVMYDTKRQ